MANVNALPAGSVPCKVIGLLDEFTGIIVACGVTIGTRSAIDRVTDADTTPAELVTV